MLWDVEFTDVFGEWWSTLSESQQDDVAAIVTLLERRGPRLQFPYSSGINGSRHTHMRELRVQSRGNPLRVFYAFDPAARPSCSLRATRQAIVVSTRA